MKPGCAGMSRMKGRRHRFPTTKRFRSAARSLPFCVSLVREALVGPMRDAPLVRDAHQARQPGPQTAPDSKGLAAAAIAFRPSYKRSGLPFQLGLVIGEHDPDPEMRSGGSMAAAHIDEFDNPLPEFERMGPAQAGCPIPASCAETLNSGDV